MKYPRPGDVKYGDSPDKAWFGVNSKTEHLLARWWRYVWLLAALWTGGIAVSLAWNLHVQPEQTLALARKSAQLTFENDVLYRRWASRQGGVYVPISEHTPPNPYLEVPHRDVTTTTGVRLTLVNPAYMARQVNAMAGGGGEARGHLTSLKPVRPENAPDAWERTALLSFERGAKEVSSVEGAGAREHLRLMRPFVTEQPCLKCHAGQGYKVGDVRGGISVSVPMAPLRTLEKHSQTDLALAHAGLWLLGLVGILVSGKGLTRQARARQAVEAELRSSEARFRALYEQAPLGIARVDSRTGRFQQVNRRYCEIAGRSETEMLTLDYQTITHPDDLQASLDNTGQLVDGSRRFFEMDKRYVRPDGSVVWVSLTVSPEWTAGETPRSHIATVADITARKLAEEELRGKTEELRTANNELARFNSAMVDRELRMVELKEEVNQLCRLQDKPHRYSPPEGPGL
jgi:PAS domain S-box-containing protein